MTLEQAIGNARERAREMKLDPSLTVAEVYEGELLRRLQQKLRGGLVWKGGTVLRLEGSERFSRDLDANRHSGALSAARIAAVLRAVARGLDYLRDVAITRQPQSVVALYRFALEGLLQPLKIIVEVSLREKILLAVTTISTARIAHPWGLEPVIVARLDPAELLAEKVRALVMRMAARDIYDVDWLLRRGVEFDPELFIRKMRYCGGTSAPVDPAAALEKAIAKLQRYDPGRAKTELANLFPAAQHNLSFAVIVEDVLRALQSWRTQIA